MPDVFLEWVWPLILLFLGYVCGKIAEARHYRSIKAREQKELPRPVVTFDETILPDNVKFSTLAIGSAVISTDYFKRLIAYLRDIFGGRVGAYESLVDRARREAILRMLEQQPQADMFINVRLETSSIWSEPNGKRPIACVEAIAYGTAIFVDAAFVDR